MSRDTRLMMVLVGGIASGVGCYLLVLLGSDAGQGVARFAGMAASLITMGLLALALWRQG